MSNGQKKGYFLIEMLTALALLGLVSAFLARIQQLIWQQHQAVERIQRGVVGGGVVGVAPDPALRAQLEQLLKKRVVMPGVVMSGHVSWEQECTKRSH